MVKVILASLLVIVTLSMCVAQEQNYFPLKVGNNWEYKFLGSDEDIQSISVFNYDQELNVYLIRKTTKMGDLIPIINEEMIEPRNNKLLLIGKRGVFYNEWKLISNHIILNYPLEINSTWKSDDGDELSDFVVVDLITLKVGAGEFTNVCKLKQTIRYHASDNSIKLVGVKYVYYAPNVGLIKEEIVEKDKSISPFLELTKYNLK